MNMEIHRKQRFDVAILGGGTAGTFAAIAAAKCGARTILVEKNSRIGGTITVAGVNFPGLFYAWGRQIIDGPCWEAIQRTAALGGAAIPDFTYKPKCHWEEQIRVNKLLFTYVLNEMCCEAGVHVLTNAMISHAEEQEEKVCLFVTDKSGLIEYNVKIAIDATGDANLTQILGYDCVKSAVQQPATLYNHLTGYRVEDVDFEELKDKLEKSNLSCAVDAKGLMYALRAHGIDKHVKCEDADTSEGRSGLEFAAIEELAEINLFLRTVKGLENISFDYVADETGIRESNRIVGEKEVTAEDYLKGVFYPDSVCYSFYPVDLHVEDGIEKIYLKDGIVPKIPYGALIPKGAKRLICAGRCISSDTYANSALRVQAACMAMGQVAGCAAALAVSGNTYINEISVKELCQALESIGAITPKEENEAKDRGENITEREEWKGQEGSVS